MVAAKLGAHVTLSDASHLPKCLENCMKSCEANNISDIKVRGLTWGQFTPDLVQMNPDIIIASDCFYDTEGKCSNLVNFKSCIVHKLILQR